MIGISFEPSMGAYAPGETITGRVRWSELADVRELHVRLIWYTSGKGDRDVGIAAQSQVNVSSASGESPFRFVAPNGPYSFSGQLISLIWAVEVVAFPSEEAESRTLVIGPDRKEIDLTEAPRVEGDSARRDRGAEGRRDDEEDSATESSEDGGADGAG